MLRLIKLLFFGSLALLAFALYKGDELPPPTRLLPQLQGEPVQKPTSRRPFDVHVNNIDYHIKPLYSYELYGLVVSKHEADSFIDYAHKQWGDHLNTADLCVIWGENAFSGVYENMSFSSAQWTCYANASDQETWEQFSGERLSNNYMLSDRRDILSALKKVRVGDQIHFKGYLAEYSHGDNFRRGSSTVRTDTGNGACETVYTESFDILQRAPTRWRIIRWVAGLLLISCIYAWFALPHQHHFD
ncbi:hypothetical protein AGMMS50225_12130 [Betaproteobacteria bacterium]|nr:hypothetical protein AGMMS50225_12130 [Betaproteobacteria bacterium]